jgi:hypothetical protein
MSVRCEFRALEDRRVVIFHFEPGWCVRDFQDAIQQLPSDTACDMIYLLPDRAQFDGINLFGELKKLPTLGSGFSAIVGLSDLSRVYFASAAALTQRGMRFGFYRSLDEALTAIQARGV